MRSLVPTAGDLELAGEPLPSSGLSSLDLHGNHIGDEGCIAAANLLQSPLLGSLTQLGLSICAQTLYIFDRMIIHPTSLASENYYCFADAKVLFCQSI